MTRESLLLGAAGGLAMISMFALPTSESAPRWAFYVRIALAAVWIALVIVDARSDHAMLRSPAYAAIILAGGVAALCFLAWSAARNWRDEEALAEDFGPHDSYIPRPHILSTRARALLSLAFLAAILALLAAFAFSTPFAPE